MKMLGAVLFVILGIGVMYFVFSSEGRKFYFSPEEPLGNRASMDAYFKERGLASQATARKTMKGRKVIKEENAIAYTDTSRDETIYLILDDSGKLKKIEFFFFLMEGRESAFGAFVVSDICWKYWKELTGKEVELKDITKPGGRYTLEAKFSNEKMDASLTQTEEGNRNYFYTMNASLK